MPNNGASDHMTFDSTLFTNITYLANPVHIILPYAWLKTITQIGQIALLPILSLKNVFHVPEFKYDLLSVSKLLDQALYTKFYSDTCIFQGLTTDLVVAVAQKAGGLYRVDSIAFGKIGSKASLSSGSGLSTNNSSRLLPSPSFSHMSSNTIICNNLSFDVFLTWSGHTSITTMEHIPFCQGKLARDFLCKTCVMAKSPKFPFNKNLISTQFPF